MVPSQPGDLGLEMLERNLLHHGEGPQQPEPHATPIVDSSQGAENGAGHRAQAY